MPPGECIKAASDPDPELEPTGLLLDGGSLIRTVKDPPPDGVLLPSAEPPCSEGCVC